jgi:hypothetical protein
MGAVDAADAAQGAVRLDHQFRPAPTTLGATVEEEQAAFLQSISHAGELEGDARTKAVLAGIQGRFSQTQFSYGRDPDTEGVRDFSSPVTHILEDRGQQVDCEDFATMAQFWGDTAIEAGLLPEGARFEIVEGVQPPNDNDNDAPNHALCVYYDPNGESYALDGTAYDDFAGWARAETHGIETFQQYIDRTGFEPRKVSSLEDYTALAIVEEHPGEAHVDLPESVKGVDIATGAERELPEGIRCAPTLITARDGSVTGASLELDDGSVVQLDDAEVDGFVDSLRDTDGGFVTTESGEYFSWYPFKVESDLPPIERTSDSIGQSISDEELARMCGVSDLQPFPHDVTEYLEQFSAEHFQEHYAELSEGTALVALSGAGASVAEAVLPALASARKYRQMRKRRASYLRAGKVLQRWAGVPRREKTRASGPIDAREMRDLLKLAPALDLDNDAPGFEDPQAAVDLKRTLRLLAQHGESHDTVKTVNRFLRLLDEAAGNDAGSPAQSSAESFEKLRELRPKLRTLGVFLTFHTTKRLGRGDITDVTIKIKRPRRLLAAERRADRVPMREDVRALLEAQRNNVAAYESLADYGVWKLRHHGRRAGIFAAAAVIGTVPDAGASDHAKAFGYFLHTDYLKHKTALATANIRFAVSELKRVHGSDLPEPYARLVEKLEKLLDTKRFRSNVKRARDRFNWMTHTVSGVATIPSYVAGPVGPIVRQSVKAGAKVGNAVVAATRLGLDARQRKKEDTFGTVVDVFAELKTLYGDPKYTRTAEWVAETVFGLQSEQLAALCRTTLVERGKLKLSVSANGP